LGISSILEMLISLLSKGESGSSSSCVNFPVGEDTPPMSPMSGSSVDRDRSSFEDSHHTQDEDEPDSPFERREINISSMEEIPKVYRDWLEEHEQKLESKRLDSEKRKLENTENARQDLRSLYEKRTVVIERNQKQNRVDEQDTQEKHEHSLSEGSDWTRVCNLCDLNDSAPTIKDRGKLKDMMMKLKFEAKDG